jgi:hypothetical protein
MGHGSKRRPNQLDYNPNLLVQMPAEEDLSARYLYLNNAVRKNLAMGLNYQGTSASLNGCETDAYEIDEMLKNYFRYTSSGKVFYNNLSSQNGIATYFDNFLKTAKSGDRLFFSYSGHGSYVTDVSGDEPDGRDEVLIGYGLRAVSDDQLYLSLKNSLPKNTVLFLLIDACHSGSSLDLVWRWIPEVNALERVSNRDPLDSSKVIVMISGCQDTGTSAEATIEGKTQGALSWAFKKIVTSEDISMYTFQTLINRINNVLKASNFTQTATLSTNVPTILDEYVTF